MKQKEIPEASEAMEEDTSSSIAVGSEKKDTSFPVCLRDSIIDADESFRNVEETSAAWDIFERMLDEASLKTFMAMWPRFIP